MGIATRSRRIHLIAPALWVLACSLATRLAPTAAPSSTAAPVAFPTDSPPVGLPVILPTALPVATATKASTPTVASTTTPAATETPGATSLPDGACLQPPDDYTHVNVNGETISARTLWMLERAKDLYSGPADLLRVTQGSYRTDVGQSFGTHAGGGAVDISIRDPQTNTFLLSETDAMVHALRLAGFAAWYRPPGALGTGSPPHIHAIAVGDAELSPAATAQLTGAEGYFKGMDGLPPPNGPNPDPFGGPIVCSWMNP